MSHTELYEILNIKQNANDKEIKRAYRKIAVKYHPDKNDDPNAVDIFKKATEAYEILIDPKKRQIYDKYGLNGFNKTHMHNQTPFFTTMQQDVTPIMKISYTISLSNYFKKNRIKIEYERNVKCEDCDSTGFTDKKKHNCPQCHGVGMILEIFQQGNMFHQMSKICPKCSGSKINISSEDLICKKCNSQGVVNINDSINVDIPKDILNNPTVVVANKGSWHVHKYVDLHIKFKLQFDNSEDYILSKDNKLTYIMRINYVETICGFRRILDHPSGEELLIISEKGNIINPNKLYIIENRGINHDNMYISFIINYIDNIKIPRKNAGILNFENLESILGDRYAPNFGSDSEFDSQNIYTLSTIPKINISDTDLIDDESNPEHLDRSGNKCVYF